jgi:hypothetical protein
VTTDFPLGLGTISHKPFFVIIASFHSFFLIASSKVEGSSLRCYGEHVVSSLGISCSSSSMESSIDFLKAIFSSKVTSHLLLTWNIDFVSF